MQSFELPGGRSQTATLTGFFVKMPKANAGRMLDDREWSQLPGEPL